MRDLPATSVFTTADAAALGWTRSALKNAVRQGRLLRIRRGIYAAVAEVDPKIRAMAAARAHPDCPVSDRSALLLHGLPLLGRPPDCPELTVRPASNANMPGADPFRARLREHDVTVVDGVLITSVARTLVDVARHRQGGVAVAALDAALHREATTLTEIHDVLDFCRDWIGAPRARRAVALSDERAESPLESISRLVLPRLGFPAPETQKEFFDQYAHLVGRGDFYWDEFGVVGEADGRGKYDERPVLTGEKDRQEELEDLSLVVVRWGWRHVYSDQRSLRVKVERATERGKRREHRPGFLSKGRGCGRPSVPTSGNPRRAAAQPPIAGARTLRAGPPRACP